MTSRNFSSAKRGYHLTQKEILKRRLWPMGLTALMFFMYYVVIFLIALSITRGNYAGHDFLLEHAHADATVRDVMASMAVSYLGSYTSSFITTIAAVVLSLQGYAYLHQRNAIDFYESQPVLRRSHFIDIIVNSFLIYIVSYVAMLLIALLLATVYSAVNVAVLTTVGIMLLADIALFLACFAIATLAAMLTGNSIVAILATGVLFFIEAMYRMVIEGLKSEFFQTYAGEYGMRRAVGYIMPFHHVAHEFGQGKVWHNLVVALVFFALAYLAYSFRKNESAGSAVVFRPIRAVVKIAIAVLSGLIGAFILVGTSEFPTAIFFALFSVFVVCCVMEIIYAFSFKALFRHLPEMFIAMGLVVAILLTFRFDLIGFDRYAPNPRSIANVIVVPSDTSLSSYYDENGEQHWDSLKHFEKHMHIEDPAPVIDMVKECRDAMRSDPEERNVYRGTFTVVYKTKLGRTVARRYRVPDTVSAEKLDQVYGDPGFKEGFYAIYHMECLEGKKVTANYSNYVQSKEVNGIDFAKFQAAYLADLEKLNVSYALQHRNIGYINVADHVHNVHLECVVYEGFDRTIAFLKEAGIYIETPFEKATLPKKITITAERRMFFKEDESAEDDDDDEYYADDYAWQYDDPLVVEYTDSDKIKEIMENVNISAYSSTFENFIRTENDYYVSVEDGVDVYDVYFLEGQVPDFVNKDLKKAGETLF